VTPRIAAGPRLRAACGLIAGLHEAQDAVDLRGIQLPEQESAGGELSRLGLTGAQLDQPLRQDAKQRETAGRVELDDVLAGVAAGGGEPEYGRGERGRGAVSGRGGVGHVGVAGLETGSGPARAGTAHGNKVTK
jgi:hypothetical protein